MVRPGTRREVAVEIELSPAAPASLFDDIARFLPSIPRNREIDRMTLIDAGQVVLADFVRDANGWTRVAVALTPAVAPGASPGVAPGAALPFFDLRKKLGLLTASEKQLASGDSNGLRALGIDLIGMISDKAVVSPSGSVFALAQRPDGAFVIAVGDSSGIEVPPAMVEIARGGGPAGIPSLPVAAPVFPSPTSVTSPAPPAPPAPPAATGAAAARLQRRQRVADRLRGGSR